MESALERHVVDAAGKVQPGAAIDFAIIIQIITTLMGLIQNCPFGNAKKAMKAGSTEAKVAVYNAVKNSGFGGNAVDLTNELIERGKNATDEELDETIAGAMSLPGLSKFGALLLAIALCGSTALAGPFPSVADGPFPLTVEGGDQESVATVATPSTGSGGERPLLPPELFDDRALAPTSHEAIQFALSMYRGVLPEHTFLDPGCGDGRVLIAAVRKWNCSGLGIEIDPEQAELARRCVEAAGLSHRIQIVEGDATTMNIPKVNAGFAFLYPETLEALADVIASIPAFVSYQHPVAGLKETRSQYGKFYSKEPVVQAETKVVAAQPYAVWNGQVHTHEWNANCDCEMCSSIRSQLRIPRTTTVVVQPEQQASVSPQPQRRGHFQRQCINGVCQDVWVWDN